eukprot:5193061-Pyramimonas_sp.AAC.2
MLLRLLESRSALQWLGPRRCASLGTDPFVAPHDCRSSPQAARGSAGSGTGPPGSPTQLCAHP